MDNPTGPGGIPLLPGPEWLQGKPQRVQDAYWKAVAAERGFARGLDSAVTGMPGQFATHRGTGAVLAGIGARQQGQNAGGVIGSVAAPLVFGGMANSAIDAGINALSKAPNPYLKLAGVGAKLVTNAALLPMAGSAIGRTTQDLAGKFMAPITGAAGQGAEVRAQAALNPGSTGNRAQQAIALMNEIDAQKRAGLRAGAMDANDVEVDRYKRIINPLLDKQAQLRMQMMPVDTAAALSVNAGKSLGNMYERSIAGTSSIAQQIAANNPYGQVMVS